MKLRSSPEVAHLIYVLTEEDDAALLRIEPVDDVPEEKR